MDPEALNSQVTKYAKFVTQLEKGLPPNNVVPQLKYKVEKMKEKVRRAEVISEPDSDALVLVSGGKKNHSPTCLPQQLAKWCSGDEKRRLVSVKWQAD